ncbi:MAG: hypothetical protein Q9169_000441 [Polycauliona sp. 2 TL-2023]
MGFRLVLPSVREQEGHWDINLRTTDTLFDLWVFGFPVETGGGNLDTGVWINVNLQAAKGHLAITLVDGDPKDQVWLIADLHLPFRQHFYKKIHMFNIPHRPGPPKNLASTA